LTGRAVGSIAHNANRLGWRWFPERRRPHFLKPVRFTFFFSWISIERVSARFLQVDDHEVDDRPERVASVLMFLACRAIVEHAANATFSTTGAVTSSP